MDKQKMNLDQLYQERFQSFEMEPSSETSALMKSKLKKAKTMHTIQWVATAVVAAIVVVTIAYFTFKSNDISTQVNQENIENTTIEKLNITNETSNSKTQPTQETPIDQTAQTNKQENDEKSKDVINDKNQNVEISSTQSAKDVESLSGSYQKQTKKVKDHSSILASSESTKNATITDSQEEYISTQKGEQLSGSQIASSSISKETNDLILDAKNSSIDENHIAIEASDDFSKINRNEAEQDRNSSKLIQLESKKGKLPYVSEEVDLEKKSAKLNSRNWLGASKSKFKSSSKLSGPFNSTDQKSGKLEGFFDLHFSPMLWNNQASWDNPSLDTSWTYSLQNNPQLSFEFGFSFQLHHQDLPLFMQIGLDYQILKEKIDYNFTRRFEDPNLSYWDYDSLWSIEDVLDTFYIIVDSNQFVIDSIYTQDTLLTSIDSSYNSIISKEEKNKTNVNTYRYLNIPLLLGYEFSSANDKWNFQILGGAAIAINLKNKGYYYTSTGDFASYSGKVNPQIVWNLYAAANVNYRWKKWQLFAQPEFQYQLNESELSDGIPRRKYQFYKLKFGIRYQLF